MGVECCKQDPGFTSNKPAPRLNRPLVVVGDWHDHDTRIIVTLLRYCKEEYCMRSFDREVDREVNPGA